MVVVLHLVLPIVFSLDILHAMTSTQIRRPTAQARTLSRPSRTAKTGKKQLILMNFNKKTK